MEVRRKVLLIKEMIELGYRDKYICMVLQVNQPYVSRIRTKKFHLNTNKRDGEVVEMTDEEKARLKALNTIISMPELPGRGFGLQDKLYIKVLKFFLIPKEDVHNLYFHLTRSQFFGTWLKKDMDIRGFDSEKIGVPYMVYIDLIIDALLRNEDRR